MKKNRQLRTCSNEPWLVSVTHVNGRYTLNVSRSGNHRWKGELDGTLYPSYEAAWAAALCRGYSRPYLTGEFTMENRKRRQDQLAEGRIAYVLNRDSRSGGFFAHISSAARYIKEGYVCFGANGKRLQPVGLWQ